MSVSEETNGLAWERLGGAAKKRKCVTLMISALENAGLLLPEVIHENKEVTVASPNIRKPISIYYNNSWDTVGKISNFPDMKKIMLPKTGSNY